MAVTRTTRNGKLEHFSATLSGIDLYRKREGGGEEGERDNSCRNRGQPCCLASVVTIAHASAHNERIVRLGFRGRSLFTWHTVGPW